MKRQKSSMFSKRNRLPSLKEGLYILKDQEEPN